MAAFAQRFYRLGLCSLVLFAAASSFVEVDAAAQKLATESSSPNITIPAQIFDELVEANFDYWNEKSQKDLALLDAKESSKEEISESAVKQRKSASEQEAFKFFIRIINNEERTELSLKARIGAAQLLKKRGKDLKRAARILNDGLKQEENFDASPETRADLRVAIGDLALYSQNFEGAEKAYKEAIDLLSAEEFLGSPIRTQALIAIADLNFRTSRFDSATRQYTSVLHNISKAQGVQMQSQALLIPDVQARLVWSSFREGNYRGAARWAHEFTRVRFKYQSRMTEAVVNEVLRIGAVALYEQNDEKAFVAIASDSLAGELGKQLLVRSLEVYRTSGRESDVEPLARSIESYFFKSDLYLDFSIARAKSAEEHGEPAIFYPLAVRLVGEFGTSKPWVNSKALSRTEEEKRARLVKHLTEVAGEYFYKEAVQTQSSSSFAACAKLFSTRLEEADNRPVRGKFHLRAGQCLHQTREYEAAWMHAQKSLAYALDDNELVAGYALHVLVARDSSRAAGFKEREQKRLRYEQSVDSYFAAYPNEQSAREAVFEFALAMQVEKKLEVARSHLERLLTSLPTSPEGVEKALQEKALKALSNINVIESNPEIAARAQARVERFTERSDLSEEALQVIGVSNSTTLRNFVFTLRKQGRLVESARVGADWASKFPLNPDAPSVALDSIKSWAELMDWQQVIELCNFFNSQFRSQKLKFEVSYWLGRAQEAQLAFASAASSYEQAALGDDSTLSKKLRTDALERAVNIHSQMKDDAAAGRVLKKLMTVSTGTQKANAYAASLALQAAERFASVNRYSEANELFVSVQRNSNASEGVKAKAELGSLLLSLKVATARQSARLRLEALASKMAQVLKKDKHALAENQVLVRAVDALNLADENDFLALNMNIGGYDADELAERKLAIATKVSARVSLLQATSGNESEKRNAYMTAARLQYQVHKDYERIATAAAEMSPNVLERFTRVSDSALSSAKGYGFRALETAPLGSIERVSLMRQIPTLASSQSTVEPKLEVKEPSGVRATLPTLRNAFLSESAEAK